MLYICIPVYNEAPTIGVLLWRIRKVFQEYSREYEILVYDDGSSDGTGEVVKGYERVLPLTLLGGERRVGYAGALSELLRVASQRTRYARRDAVITLQGDFTDSPEHLPEFVKRFEGGADIVIGQTPSTATPIPENIRKLRRLASWALRPSIKTPGIEDPFGSYRLYRVSALRDALKAGADAPLVSGEGWAANVDALLTLLPHARRTETFDLAPRFDLRPRDSRRKPWSDAWALFLFGRGARARAAKLQSAAAPS